MFFACIFQQQQLLHHESRLDDLERDLKDHRTYPPEKGAKPRVIQDYLEKEQYLEYEVSYSGRTHEDI